MVCTGLFVSCVSTPCMESCPEAESVEPPPTRSSAVMKSCTSPCRVFVEQPVTFTKLPFLSAAESTRLTRCAPTKAPLIDSFPSVHKNWHLPPSARFRSLTYELQPEIVKTIPSCLQLAPNPQLSQSISYSLHKNLKQVQPDHLISPPMPPKLIDTPLNPQN